MKKLTMFFFLCSEIVFAVAQVAPIVPTTTAVANASVADSRHWSAFSNPSGIAFTSAMNFGFQYENRYFLSELSTKSIDFVLPSRLISTGISASYSGYSLYNEIMLGIGFSRNFSDKFSLGVQLDYFAAYFAASDKYYGAFFPQIGLNASLTPDFHLGFSTFNPFQSIIKSVDTSKRIPSVFSLGVEYYLSPELNFKAQVDKEISSSFRTALGAEYSLLNFLTVKAGAYHIDYLVPCFGFSTDFASFSFNLNTELHPLLGLVSMASVRYFFKKNK